MHYILVISVQYIGQFSTRKYLKIELRLEKFKKFCKFKFTKSDTSLMKIRNLNSLKPLIFKIQINQKILSGVKFKIQIQSNPKLKRLQQ